MSFIFENDIMKSALLECSGYSHAFSTRYGGVSDLEHTKSMNLAYGRGDDDETVFENLGLFCKKAGINRDRLVMASQIHSSSAIIVSSNQCGGGKNDMSLFRELKAEHGADAFVTNESDVALLIRIADCTPILFIDSDNGVIGAAHAGWRGTLSRIAKDTVNKMCLLGARTDSIKCAIGACISACCYEVSKDFYDTFRKNDEKLCEFIKPLDNGKYHADLKGMNRQILLDCNIKAENIDICEECTAHNPEKFFSHRASKGKRGTMAAVVQKNRD